MSDQEELVHTDIELCERCGVPTCYCKFFGHVEQTENTEGEEGATKEEDGEKKPQQQQQQQQNKGGKNKGEKPHIQITVKSRTKRKNTTTVSNLEAWEIDTKEFSKAIAKKMAIGCSTKKSQTGIQIVIQGDAAQQIQEVLIGTYKVPKKQIATVRKQKKPAAEEGAE